MTPEAQKRLDEQVEYEAKLREKKKAKQEGGFYDKPIYKNPTPTPTATPTYNDPLKRNLSYAERLRQGFAGASR